MQEKEIILIRKRGGPKIKECNDGLDNDGDGFIDLNDLGCDNKRDKDETNCGDGVCEGGETDLTCPADCALPITQCNDGIDNDGDGHIDINSLAFFQSDSECIDSSDDDESPRDFCDDTDESDLGIQGTVSGEDDSIPFSYTDFCVNSTTVKEFSCGGFFNDFDPFNIDSECIGGIGCSNGACQYNNSTLQ